MERGRMGLKGLHVLALLSIALALPTVHADEDCSGHGKLVDGKCVCSAPLPVEGSPGWVGNKCATPVHHLYLDGEDVKETCEQGHVCNVVTPSEPVCFSTGIEDLGTATFHLNLLLSSDNADATVVLQGLLTNFTTTKDAASGAASTVPQAYPNSDSTYSFALRSSRESPSVQLKLTRRQLGYGAYTGLYLCASSNATTSIELRAAEHACPFNLQPNGTLQLCSGRDPAGVCPHGTCSCPPPYAPPINWVVTPGLGFEDCSTALLPLQPSVPLVVPELAAGGWAFFGLELLPAESGAELRVWAAASEASAGRLVLYLRHQQLPAGGGVDQHDLASDSDGDGGASWGRDQSVHLTLRRKDPFFQPGTWYLGVHNQGPGRVSALTVGSALYDCPNNCSGRGTCDAATATCSCSEAVSPASPGDCSISLRELALGEVLQVPPRASLTYEALVLRGIREKLAQGGGAGRLHLSASFTTTDPDPPGLPAWAAGRPVVFAAPSLEAALNQTAAGGRPLQPTGAVESLALAARGVSYSMEIGPWTIGDDGSLHLLFWSPLSSPLRLVGYNLTVALQAECPAGCSGHGTCDAATGACTCQPPFMGTDCSVDSSTFACAPGTLHPVRRDGLRGTCLAPCRDDGRSFDDGACDNLQCDGPGEGHGQLRRKGSEVECVEDGCLAGNHAVTDPSGDFTCTQRCVCPADGSACAMEPVCLPGTKQCLKGLRLAADGETCVAAACEEGSLRRAYDLEGGSAFALCLCAAAGDPASCAFTAPAQAAGNANGVVSCLPGFERQSPPPLTLTPPPGPASAADAAGPPLRRRRLRLQGSTSSARLSDGSSLVVGGRCGRPRRRGVSGGMVFFYCLLSIFLAAGLVVGGKYGVLWYEQYRYGRSVFSQGYVSWPLFGNRGAAGSGTDDW